MAATPGFDFMPAPTRLTRAMSASVVTPVGADLVGEQAAVTSTAGGAGRSCGTVNEMSVTPWSDTFCTIMSTLTSRSASGAEQAGGDAGLVGHAASR